MERIEVDMDAVDEKIRKLIARIVELEDINSLQGRRIDELTGCLTSLYIGITCGVPLEGLLKRTREVVDVPMDYPRPSANGSM